MPLKKKSKDKEISPEEFRATMLQKCGDISKTMGVIGGVFSNVNGVLREQDSARRIEASNVQAQFNALRIEMSRFLSQMVTRKDFASLHDSVNTLASSLLGIESTLKEILKKEIEKAGDDVKFVNIEDAGVDSTTGAAQTRTITASKQLLIYKAEGKGRLVFASAVFNNQDVEFIISIDGRPALKMTPRRFDTMGVNETNNYAWNSEYDTSNSEFAIVFNKVVNFNEKLELIANNLTTTDRTLKDFLIAWSRRV